MGVQTIDEVISRLDAIRENESATNSPLYLFPSLYVRVTRAVGEKVKQGGYFEDDARMEKLDVIFANRYLDAWDSLQSGHPVELPWNVSFHTEEYAGRVLILQHLLLGMNAHINFDLGIAASQTIQKGNIQALKTDFNRINDLLFSMVDSVQEELKQYSPWLKILDRIGGRNDEVAFEFSLKKARDFAWKLALDLDAAPDEAAAARIINARRQFTSGLAKKMLSPGILAKIAIRIAGLKESTDYRSMF